MGDEYLVNDDNAYKEKKKIAEVAAATLCRLNNIMKQMKDWRDDRMRLRSNIWRLKLALRVARRETDDTVHVDPLIEHQKAEMERLETTNKELKKEITDIKAALLDGGYVIQETGWKSGDKLVEVRQEYLVERERLNNEIQYLKDRLNETEKGHEHSSEVEHLKYKLKRFMMVDHTIEIIFTDIINKVAETIANLSEELVNVNQHLHRSQVRNNNQYIKIDKLKAMLRFKSGNLPDYQKRFVELENLTKRLKIELNKFDNSWNTDSNCHINLKIVEQLTTDLKNKLKNDHEAFLGAGDPDCMKYIQKIIDLRISLKQLHVELVKLSDQLSSSCPEEMVQYNKYLRQLSMLDTTLKEINVEIAKIKNNHVKKHCRIGGIEGLEYLNKIEELSAIVETARATMNAENWNEQKDIEKLKSYIDKVCNEIKQLEVMVAYNDNSRAFKRIEQLEELVVRLKSESKEKDECVHVLSEELLDIENLLKQRVKELEDAQKEITALIDENKILQGKAKQMEKRTSELQREKDSSCKEMETLQQLKCEASITKRKLQNLQAEKEELSKEIEKIRDTLRKRNEEFKTTVVEKEATEKILNIKIADIAKNFQLTTKENEKLKNELELAKSKEREGIEEENENTKRLRDALGNMKLEMKRLKVNLGTSKESLDKANHEITDLKIKLEHFCCDKKKLEASVSNLESKREMLTYQLGAEKTTAEERLKELSKLKSNHNELNLERESLKKEKEQLNSELTNLKLEKEMLQQSLKHVHAKCSTLEGEIDKYKFERDKLHEEIRNFKTIEENLAGKLEKVEAELNGAGDKISRLESENSRMHGDLNGLTLENASFKGRVQVLLSEKEELAKHIKELDTENIALKDQLNEIKMANRYSSIELNKLKMECDKRRLDNTALQITLDETKKSNEAINKANEEMKLKLNEIHSEHRILANQLKILEMMNCTLKREKELLEQEFVNNLRSKTMKVEKEETTKSNELNFREQDGQLVVYVTEKTPNEMKRNNLKPVKRMSDKTKERVKQLMVENESLKFEVLNLKSQNFEVKMQLVRMKEKVQKQLIELAEKENSEIAIKPISNKLEIVNLYYKEINSYTDRSSDNVSMVARINQPSMNPYGGLTTEQETRSEVERLLEVMNKLKVENVALKMEVNSLRCNLIVNFTEDQKKRSELRNTVEEIQALKAELMKLRTERELLKIRLDTAATNLERLESEKVALKNEVYTLRKSNCDLKCKTNELQCDYQKLKQRSTEFEGCIMRAVKKIKKHTMSKECNDNSDNDLRDLLQKCISNEKVLHSIEQEMNVEGT